MDFSKLVEESFQANNKPINEWQLYSLDLANELAKKINELPNINCKFRTNGAPISLTQLANEKFISNVTTAFYEITYDDETILFEIDFREKTPLENPKKREPIVTIGHGIHLRTFDPSSPSYTDDIASEIAKRIGEEKARSHQEQQAARIIENYSDLNQG